MGGLHRVRDMEDKIVNTGHVNPTRHMCQSQRLPDGGLELTGPFSELREHSLTLL